MIEMIFEGGYTYLMTESEYYMLLVLAGLGSATILGSAMMTVAWCIQKIIRKVTGQ